MTCPAGELLTGRARLPEALLGRDLPAGPVGHAILGAGCAGLSLALALLDHGVDDPILLIDSRTTYTDDRTWCFWDTGDEPWARHATDTWHSWTVATAAGSTTTVSDRQPYLRVTALDFYDHALRTLAEHPNIVLHLGERVADHDEAGGTAVIRTDRGSYLAEHLYDARGLRAESPPSRAAREESNWVAQTFLGQRVVTDIDVFTPETCTLMDFRVSQKSGPHFVYLLPSSRREALVEDVYFTTARITAARHRAEIAGYLGRTCGLSPSEVTIVGEERARIPMTDHRFARRTGDISHVIGTRGGATRPSTGYAFTRIQDACRDLAASVTGSTPRRRRGTARRSMLDSIFLQYVVDHPATTHDLFLRMFRSASPDALVRFLSDRSTIPDELQLLRALPAVPMLHAAVRRLTAQHHDRATT